MGKKIIPPHDPQRLSRIMDERTRMIGKNQNVSSSWNTTYAQVDITELNRQTQERRVREVQAAQQQAQADQDALKIARRVDELHRKAEAIRKRNAGELAAQHMQQAADKIERDHALQELYRNKVDTHAYFNQFGASHR